MRLPRPLYESLPLAYVIAGALALASGYALRGSWSSTLLSVAGFAALLAGAVVWLRRRDFRERAGDYRRNQSSGRDELL